MVYSMRSGCGSAGQSPVSMILRYQLSFLSMSFPIFTFMLFTLLSVSQVLANPPVITLELPSPANATNTSTTLQNFNWTVIDNVSSTITCNLTINGQTNASYNISNNTATNHSLSLANGVYVWYVICNNSVGNVGSSEIRNLTIDTLGPVITGIAVNQTDNFYSNASSNNILTLLVNATDVGPSGLYYVTANFSSANQSTTALINMTQIGNGQYAATINITNVTGMEFATANITTMAYDYAANPSNASGYVVILYNMTTPPAATCMQWGGSTTDFSTVTDFSDVSLVLDVQLNLSCLMPEVNASLLPAWFSQYTTMALINFASVDLSTQAKAMKLTNLSNNIVVNITAPGQFGDSRIYLNTSYFAELNTTASVSLYHLPFSSRPNVTADVGAAGINSSLTWVQGIGEGNLTFIVNGFSGYNVTDLTAPIISLINPPNGSSIANNTPLINISINGTGTQLSHVLIVLSNSSGYTIQYSYNATNASNVTNTANCINVSQGSELFYCAFVPASLNDSAYMLNVTANDFGGNAPGNSKNMIFNFTVDTVAPAINSVTLNDTYISSGQSVFVSVNATDRFGVTNVTANGIGLNHTAGSDIWNGSIVLTGSSGSANITIVAVDASGNTNITYSLYTIDNTAPVIIVNSPANGSTISDVSGNLTLNYTVLEAQLVGSNVSIDYGTWTSSNTSNGTIIVQFTGIDAGNHTITITAYDNASLSNSTTIWFVMSAPVNVTQKLADMQMAVGNTTLLNVSLLDATNNSIDYSNNESLIVTNLSLALWMRINISETANVTVFIPIFSGSSTNWNATNFGIETNISSSIGTNVIHNTGTSVTSMVVFLNMSRFIPNSDYTNGTIIVFHQPLADLYVLYISDDAGTLVYKLNSCSGGTPPTTVTNATMCYLNTSSNVTVYIPHLSGAALVNDTMAPIVNITSPINNSIVNNSFFTFSFDAWETNPATNFCWYNLSNATGQVNYSALSLSSFIQEGTKYRYSTVLSGLRNLAYNITVNCTDMNNRSMQVRHNFTVTDTTAPIITTISASTSDSTVTLSVTTNENAECRYTTVDTNFSSMLNMTVTNSTSHSIVLTYGSSTSGTYYVRCNDTAGNVMIISNSTPFNVTISGGVTCIENWTCTEWSACGPNNIRVRTCIDRNSCGTTVNKPPEQQYCPYSAPEICAAPCPTGYYQRPYPDCSCVPLTCASACPAGYVQNPYPDCSCILPPNATPLEVPEEITVIATRGGALVAIPSIAAERISSVTFSAAITNFTSILSIALTSRRNLADVKIEITKLDAKPLSLEEPPYKVYKYLEITAENASESDWLEAVITFKVEKLWIGTRYNASSVKLLRYSSDTWKPLETNLMSQTTTDYIFEAVTPGFSYFAITATELSTPEPILPLPSNITIDETKQSTISLTTVIVMIATITLIFIAIVIIYSKMKSARKWRPKSPM